MARKLSESLREEVRARADYLCEYCHTNERWQYVRFTVDHIVPGGGDAPENLALACFHCNRRKSIKIVAVDSATNETVEIFNPRRHIWTGHFAWAPDGLLIIPKTATGRATTALLELNRPRILAIRQADVQVNRHPPISDLS